MKHNPTLKLAILAIMTTPSFASESTLLPIQVTALTETTSIQSDALTETSGNTESGALFRQINGVDAQRLGGHGLDILIRGQGQSAVNVLIDGGKIEGGCPNRMDPATSYAELNSFDKITVIKGVQSLQYGSGGTAGTVLLEREKPNFEPEKPYQGKVYAATNSNGLSRDLGAQIAMGSEKGYILLQGSDKEADNYVDGNGNEIRSSYKTQQGHVDLGWTPSENHHIKLSHEVSKTEDALYNGNMDAPLSDMSMTKLSYEGKNFSGPVNAVELSAFQSSVDHVMDSYSLRNNTSMNQGRVPSETLVQGLKLKLSSEVSSTQLDYGVLLQSTEKTATLYNNAAPDPTASQWLMWPDILTTQNSLFAEAKTPITHKSDLIYGVRVDSISSEARNANSAPDMNAVDSTDGVNRIPYNRYDTAYNNYSGSTKVSETNWNGLLRYEQTLNNNYNWYTGLSLTTRTADETERFMARHNWTGNPDLNPEKHTQFDIGIAKKATAFNWNLSAYYDQIQDYILRDLRVNQPSTANVIPGTESRNIYVNVDAVIMGAEFDFNYQLSQAWLMGAQVSLTQGRNTTDDRNLSNMSPLNGQLHTRYNQANWYTGARLNFASEQTLVNAEFGEEKAPAWSTLDIYAGYQVNKTFQLQAGVDNLADEAYFTHVNRVDDFSATYYKVMEPGRNIWARVEAKF